MFSIIILVRKIINIKQKNREKENREIKQKKENEVLKFVVAICHKVMLKSFYDYFFIKVDFVFEKKYIESMNNEKKLELLAPAGDLESFELALNNGADAIYLGLGNFNARKKAENFDEKNLFECVKKAHFFGVKVYVTLNTLLFDNEIEEMLKLVKMATRANVDAFIVQDLGIVKILKECFENIEIHASTQMGIHNLDGAMIAEKMGIKRVVLSRETKLEDIKKIKENTNLDIEYFVQGALCVAFSGNCYFSFQQFGASGNRGMCKQPCRMMYEMSDSKNEEMGRMLSARDLCLVENLEKLIDVGVSSFKIEGRLRRSGYVAETVNAYRFALDNLQNKKEIPKLKSRLMQAYNRGEFLSSAYLENGVTDNVINKFAHNHQGVEIGRVVSIKPFKNILQIEIETKHKFCVGDGLKFFDDDFETGSIGVGSFERRGNNWILFGKTTAKVGNKVNLILDKTTEKALEESKRKVEVSFLAKAYAGKNFEIVAKAGELEAKYVSEFVVQKAQNKETTAQEISMQISKTGDTNFVCEKAETKANEIFVPKSVVNNARREVLELLERMILQSNSPEKAKFCEDKFARLLKQTTLIGNKKQAQKIGRCESIDDIKCLGEKVVVLCPRNFEVCEFEKLQRNVTAKIADAKFFVELPIIANGKDLEKVKVVLKALAGIDGIVANNVYGLNFKNDYEVIAGFGMNLANRFAVAEAFEFGATLFQKSVEVFDIETNKQEVEIVGFELPLMTFAHCPSKTLNSNDCSKCKFCGDIILRNGQKEYVVKRKKIAQCQFELFEKLD